jgi:opacity protein-like surface antigen
MPFAPRRAFAPAALCAAAFTASAAAAQVPVNPFGVGISGGAAVPTGDFGDDVNTGFSVDGLITLRVPTLPVSFRGEVGYTRFGIKQSAFEDDDEDASGNLRFFSGVANVIFSVPAGPTAVVRPYLIGGVGLYNGRVNVEGGGESASSEAANKFGFNAGAGIEIPLSGITGLGEVRFVSVRTKVDADDEDDNLALPFNANHVAIRFGVRF